MLREITAPLATSVARDRRFMVVFVGAFFATWTGVMLIHFLGNPDGLFPSPRNPSRREQAWKTRQLQRLAREGRAPTVLVLGSSRMVQVLPRQIDQITKGRSFNFAAPGSTPLDMLAQLRFALTNGSSLTHVLIGIDDQAMFGGYDTTHELRIITAPEQFAQLPLQERIRLALRAPVQVKPELTWRAITSAAHPPGLPVVQPAQAEHIMFDDGYLTHPKLVRERHLKKWDPRQVLAEKIKALRTQGDDVLLYPHGAAISERHVRYLRELLALCRRNRIRATVVLTPVYPVYDELVMRPVERELRRELSRRIERLCRRERATYRDLSSVESFDGVPFEFWDFVHLTPHNIRRMTNVAFGRRPDQGLAELPTDFQLIRAPTPVHSLNTP
jgi:hypothetical protein